MKNTEKIVAHVLYEQSSPLSSPNIVKNGGNSVVIEVILQDTNVNRNKRHYSAEVIKEALMAPHIQELLRNKSWVGEAGHPLDKTLQRQLSIVHSNVSHIVLEANLVGDKVIGIVETAMMPMGIAMRDSIRQGMVAAFSMRGAAPVVQRGNSGYVDVKSPLKIAAYDWVFYPSHEGAYQQKILKESLSLGGRDDFSIIPITEEAMFEFLKESSDTTLAILDEISGLEDSRKSIIVGAPALKLVLEDSAAGRTVIVNLEKYLNRSKFMQEILK
jgi:hypothetical protein